MFTLPELGYAYSALEPHIDAKTMEIHHTKHHQGYINNLNAALESHSELQAKSLEELLSNLDSLPQEIKTAVQNNAGGHYNHTLFWKIISPNQKGEISDDLLNQINTSFGSFDKFKELFSTHAAKRFGSGWAWLVKNQDGSLEVISTPNQDTPLALGKQPILGLDVWEHAYYLNYQNRRADYIQSFWDIVNWQEVSKIYSM